MEAENNKSNNVTIPEAVAAVGAVEPPVLPSSEAEITVVGLEEKKNYADGSDGQQALVLVSGSGMQDQLSAKRKRGRPRKQLTEESLAPTEKRGRGRPKGSGKWELWNSLADATGSHFTPHTITAQRGENIVQKICSFSQRPSDALCIMSAVGVLSSAELYRPGSYNSIVKHEGRFDIVSLSGSYAINGRGNVNGKVFLLAVQLAKPDGTLFGGAVAGSLIVREPTQVVFATFKLKLRMPLKVRHEPSRPNNGAVAVVPVQTENGRAFGSKDTSALLTIPPVSTSAPPVDLAIMNDANHHLTRIPSEPFDWNSLASSSQHLPTISDVLTGVVTD